MSTYTDVPKKHYLVGTLLLAIGAYAYVALFSFSPFDISEYSTHLPWNKPPNNAAGKIGAYFSSVLVYLFGAHSFFLASSLPASGITLIRGGGIKGCLTVSLKIIIITICLLTFSIDNFSLEIGPFLLPISGAYGHQLESIIREYIGSTGHFIFIFVLLFTISYDFITTKTPIIINGFKSYTRKNTLADDNSNLSPPTGRNENVSAQEPSVFHKRVDDAQPITTVEKNLPNDEDHKYIPPKPTAFKTSPSGGSTPMNQKHKSISEKLVAAFKDFRISGQVTEIVPGPTVTVYEYQASRGTKLSKMIGLSEDIALALKVDSIIITPISGKNVVGIQVPNEKRDTIFFGDVLESEEFALKKAPLTFAIGQDIKGRPVCEDLASMPHLLMAGQTGSGKSVAINSLLCSILMKSKPSEVRMILVDPKILELKVYEGIPHLAMPVITEPERASLALKWAVQEMERRYKLMERARVRNLTGFNAAWSKLTSTERESFNDLTTDCSQNQLPYLLLVIDELADLMLSAPKDVESSIQRLAQKARACGIHLVLATQRPSVDVITGVIKANLPSRISFKVFSRGDSRTILDSMGAEKLLGKGDLLYLKPGNSKLQRIQGAFLSDEEVIKFIADLCVHSKPEYWEDAINWIDNEACSSKPGSCQDSSEEDPKWDKAISIAQSQGNISASFLQRQLKIGYNRAARIVDSMARQGLVGGADGAKPRKWLGPAG